MAIVGPGFGVNKRSKQAVRNYGAELVVNGAVPYSVTTGWTTSTAALSVVGNKLRLAGSSSGQGRASQTIAVEAGATYFLECDTPSRPTTSRFRVGTTVGGFDVLNITPLDAVAQDFVAPGTSISLSIVDADVTNTIDFGKISLRKVL